MIKSFLIPATHGESYLKYKLFLMFSLSGIVLVQNNPQQSHSGKLSEVKQSSPLANFFQLNPPPPFGYSLKDNFPLI